MPRKTIRREFDSVASSPFFEINDFATKQVCKKITRESGTEKESEKVRMRRE